MGETKSPVLRCGPKEFGFILRFRIAETSVKFVRRRSETKRLRLQEVPLGNRGRYEHAEVMSTRSEVFCLPMDLGRDQRLAGAHRR